MGRISVPTVHLTHLDYLHQFASDVLAVSENDAFPSAVKSRMERFGHCMGGSFDTHTRIDSPRQIHDMRLLNTNLMSFICFLTVLFLWLPKIDHESRYVYACVISQLPI